MLQKTTIVAVPTAADSWTAMTNIRVPAGVKRISKITVSLSPDPGTSATSIRAAPIYQILGSGLGEQSPHSYLGAFGGWGTVTDGTQTISRARMSYEVDIPVQVGSDIQCQVSTLDEAITAGTTSMELQFDDVKGVSSQNSMADQVNVAGSTSADNWFSVGTLTVPTGSPGKQPSKIIGVSIGLAVDPGTTAISLRNALRIQLSGAGLKGGADAIEFLGESGSLSEVSAGAVSLSNTTRFVDLRNNPIPVNTGGEIDVEHKFDVETPTASTVCVGVLYA